MQNVLTVYAKCCKYIEYINIYKCINNTSEYSEDISLSKNICMQLNCICKSIDR